MTRLRCLDCQDDRHCRHTGYVPAGTILVPCRCLDCDPGRSRPGCSATPWSRTTSVAASTAASLPPSCWSAAAQPDTSLCEACEYRRYLAATGGRDLANEERDRWGQPPIPRPELG